MLLRSKSVRVCKILGFSGSSSSSTTITTTLSSSSIPRVFFLSLSISVCVHVCEVYFALALDCWWFIFLCVFVIRCHCRSGLFFSLY